MNSKENNEHKINSSYHLFKVQYVVSTIYMDYFIESLEWICDIGTITVSILYVARLKIKEELVSSRVKIRDHFCPIPEATWNSFWHSKWPRWEITLLDVMVKKKQQVPYM